MDVVRDLIREISERKILIFAFLVAWIGPAAIIGAIVYSVMTFIADTQLQIWTARIEADREIAEQWNDEIGRMREAVRGHTEVINRALQEAAAEDRNDREVAIRLNDIEDNQGQALRWLNELIVRMGGQPLRSRNLDTQQRWNPSAPADRP